MKLLILNGPNLNMLGQREPGIYGSESLDSCLQHLRDHFASRTDAAGHPVVLEDFQSNSEGALIDRLQQAWREGVDGIAFNAGAYTHTSVALHDAIRSISPVPVVEVHISNIYAREDFRHRSLIAPACRGTISGFGLDSYRLAVEALMAATRATLGSLLLTFGIFAGSVLTASAQNVQATSAPTASRVEAAAPSKQQLKQQKAAAKMAKKQARQQAKEMAAAGWRAATGTDALVLQLAEKALRESSISGDARDYFVETAMATDVSYAKARKQALMRCRKALVQSMGVEIVRLVEASESSIELSEGQHEALSRYANTFRLHYEQRLGKTDVIVEAMREKADGGIEAFISVSYSAQEYLHQFLNSVKEQDPDLAEKLETLF